MTCGPDELPIPIIQKVGKEIAKPLSRIINRSIELKKCLEELKETELIESITERKE